MLLLISISSVFLAFLYVAVVFYLRSGWMALPVFERQLPPFSTLVSVLIAARDEEENISKTIEDLLAQDYPANLMEIIIVDDHSTDNTANIIESYAHRGVKLIRLRESEILNSYKKKAIAEAIKLANCELVVTTDADCRMGPRWLSTFVAFYEANNYKMISMPVFFFEEKNLFERLQTLEFLYLIGLGAAMIGHKNPNTCNGANLAYRKDVFNELNGFAGIDDLASGDDELLLHKVAARYPMGIGFCKSFDGVVFTHAKPNLKAFLLQRKRWASKTTKYKNKSMVVLGIFIWLFNVSLLINAMLGFFNPAYWLLLAASFLLKFFAELFFLVPVSGFARRKNLVGLLLLLIPVHILYFVYIGLAGNSGKYAWKGRMVR